MPKKPEKIIYDHVTGEKNGVYRQLLRAEQSGTNAPLTLADFQKLFEFLRDKNSAAIGPIYTRRIRDWIGRNSGDWNTWSPRLREINAAFFDYVVPANEQGGAPVAANQVNAQEAAVAAPTAANPADNAAAADANAVVIKAESVDGSGGDETAGLSDFIQRGIGKVKEGIMKQAAKHFTQDQDGFKDLKAFADEVPSYFVKNNGV